MTEQSQKETDKTGDELRDKPKESHKKKEMEKKRKTKKYGRSKKGVVEEEGQIVK